MGEQPPPDIAARVTALREARGWTQADLAAEAGVTRSYLSRLEGGDYREPSVWKLQLIAQALGVTILDLIEDGRDYQRVVHVDPAKADALIVLRRFKVRTLRMLEAVGDAFEGAPELQVRRTVDRAPTPPATPEKPARRRGRRQPDGSELSQA